MLMLRCIGLYFYRLIISLLAPVGIAVLVISPVSAHDGDHSDDQDFFEAWVGGYGGGNHGFSLVHGDSTAAMCANLRNAFDVWFTDLQLESSYGIPAEADSELTGIEVRCEFTYENNLGERADHSWNGILRCTDIFDSGYEFWWNGPCPVQETPEVCTQVGNPIFVATGRKVEYQVDWSSGVDSRFRFDRHYSSSVGLNDKTIGALGIGWSSSHFMYEDDWFVFFGTHRTREFQAVSGYYKPVHNNHSNTLVWSKIADFDKIMRDGQGNESRFVYIDDQRYGFLVERHWIDGYTITYEHDASYRVVAMEDNRGQRAEFTWATGIGSAPQSGITIDGEIVGVTQASYALAPSETLERIEVDLDYDGVTLQPDVQIDYTYSDQVFYYPKQPGIALSSGFNLDQARVVETGTGTILSDYHFQYDAQNPNLLTGIDDGRLTSAGQHFDFATFAYGDYQVDPNGSNFKRAVSSSHPGSADFTQVSFPTYRDIDGDGIDDVFDVTVTNPLGKEAIYTFETVRGQHRLVGVEGISTVNCLPSNTTAAYDLDGRVTERIAKNGARTVFTRDYIGRVLTRTDDADGANPRVTSYTWPAYWFQYYGNEPTWGWRKPLTRTTSELSETFTYDVDGLLTSYSQEDVLTGSPDFGDVRTWDYNYTTLASGLKVLTSLDGPGLATDGVNDITTYTYNARGQLLTVTDPNGLKQEVLAYGVSGLPTLVKDHQGFEWALDYDLEGQLISSAFQPNGVNDVTTYTYDIIGQMTSSTDALGRTWDYTYDEAKRLVEIEAPSGETIQFDHDAMGNVIRTEYADAVAVTKYLAETQYDELGRILQALGSNGQTTDFSHDVEDNLATVTDASSLTTTMSYDALNRMTDIADRANGTTLMDHDESDQVTSYTDPRGLATGFSYNGFGDLVGEVSTDRGTMSYTYNNRGLTTSMTDGRGVVTNYAYDDGGRLTNKTYPSDSSLNQTFTYYAATFSQTHNRGDLRYIDDQTGRQFFYSESNRGNLNQDRRRIDGVDYRTYYDTRAMGEVWRTRYPSGHQLRPYYNADGELTRLRWRGKDPVTGAWLAWKDVVNNATYLPMGPLASMRYGDDYTLQATYDSSYRLTRLRDVRNGAELRDTLYSWTNRDNLGSVTDTLDPTQNETFGYSPREFLSSADGAWGDLDWLYDSVGNRTQQMSYANGSTSTDVYTYPNTSNRLDQIVFSTGGSRTLTYDAAGNVTFDNRNGPGYGYNYDAAGRMSSFAINGVIQAEYEYNSLGQQVIRRLTQAGQTIHSIHDTAGNRIAEYDYDESTGTSTLIREYIWANGQVVGVFENGQLYYVRTDHIGRPSFATDRSGAIVWEASYKPFGGAQTSSGPNPDLRFPGQWFQSETGLHQNWMRDYDPTTGRYMQADPLGLVDGASVYGYALQNPGRYVDPRGEEGTVPYTLPNLPSELGSNWLPYQHPNNPHPTYVRRCDSNQYLQFNQGIPGSGGNRESSHWHYFVGGLTNLDKESYRPNRPGFNGGTHLPPGFVIMVTDCGCPTEETDYSVPLIPIPKFSPKPRNRGGGGQLFNPLPDYLN